VLGLPANDLVIFPLRPNAVTRSLERDWFMAILAIWDTGLMVRNRLDNEYCLSIRFNRLPTDGTGDHFILLIAVTVVQTGQLNPCPNIRMKARGFQTSVQT
jgi:hypothetical protein